MKSNESLEEKKRPASPVNEDESVKKFKREPVPDGMSRNQWKKLQRQKRWDEQKDEYRKIKRDKKKAAKQRRKDHITQLKEQGLTEQELDDALHYHQLKKERKLPESQTPSDAKFIFDCSFDDLMSDKEIVSLSNQITRAYSAKRHCKYDLPLDIVSFQGKLVERFEKLVGQYKLWKGINFNEESLESLITDENKDKFIYFTADTDEVIEELEPGMTYIIGAIVDKNRHKNLCINKAKEMGLRVGRLPIDKYIQMNGRQVLATSHVYEICCKWYECAHDWEKAFNEVLPPRKVKGKLEELKKKRDEFEAKTRGNTHSPNLSSDLHGQEEEDEVSEVSES
ncbi:tRNA (guanine(9)-N(1))-methyltransferase [Scheffersomyces spartinae]|uniref:tRNA (guanine(9)-N1)-methyltransferase n=1 Tax=Scheffersomyces spartinae TaxID=45513 RepID=A0A9P7V8K9_9ASCO|nr:tRNA (guanine(9)-N(1))-methyltransferase [Scheffersomyces spartinae]KAG7193420.1 tRNA (guanine(9)-N(1))-methyltransferase [Scheffersomyces spartinae]